MEAPFAAYWFISIDPLGTEELDSPLPSPELSTLIACRRSFDAPKDCHTLIRDTFAFCCHCLRTCLCAVITVFACYVCVVRRRLKVVFEAMMDSALFRQLTFFFLMSVVTNTCSLPAHLRYDPVDRAIESFREHLIERNALNSANAAHPPRNLRIAPLGPAGWKPLH